MNGKEFEFEVLSLINFYRKQGLDFRNILEYTVRKLNGSLPKES